jgi:hypothetical protein
MAFPVRKTDKQSLAQLASFAGRRLRVVSSVRLRLIDHPVSAEEHHSVDDNQGESDDRPAPDRHVVVPDGNEHLVAFYFVTKTHFKRKNFCGE